MATMRLRRRILPGKRTSATNFYTPVVQTIHEIYRSIVNQQRRQRGAHPDPGQGLVYTERLDPRENDEDSIGCNHRTCCNGGDCRG